MVSVMLEFDAATFKLRMRSGLIVADAKYQCLVARLVVCEPGASTIELLPN